MIQLIEAGHSYKVHGIKGELKLSLDANFKNEILQQGVLFFNLDGNDVPFFIESYRAKEDALYMKFKELESPEAARELSNKIIYTDKNKLQNTSDQVFEDTNEDSEESFEDFIEYIILDKNTGIQTKIIGIEEYPSQWMALCIVNNKEVMIPMRVEWIEQIDDINQLITMNLPDGIFEL
ncbi:MAG: hypothetical protein IPL42_03110 [Saprospiraceae bacterium]|nr:hypothetical protein [Saprospiraceae bacterium]